MVSFITFLLIFHIASGFTALVTGGAASLTKKGGINHKRSGRIYFWSMTGVFITACLLGYIKNNAFLFMVGFFSYYLVVRGYRQLYLKGLGDYQKATWLDWMITMIALAFGLGLISWAVYQKIVGSSFWPVPLVFGSISTAYAAADCRLYIRGPKHKLHWLAGHIASMGAGYIATWTAFVVTNVRFLPSVVVWLLPTIIGSLFIFKSIRKYTKRGSTKTALVLP